MLYVVINELIPFSHENEKNAKNEKPEPQTTVEPSPVVNELDKILPDDLTPRQALDELYRLKQLADQNK